MIMIDCAAYSLVESFGRIPWNSGFSSDFGQFLSKFYLFPMFSDQNKKGGSILRWCHIVFEFSDFLLKYQFLLKKIQNSRKFRFANLFLYVRELQNFPTVIPGTRNSGIRIPIWVPGIESPEQNSQPRRRVILLTCKTRATRSWQIGGTMVTMFF